MTKEEEETMHSLHEQNNDLLARALGSESLLASMAECKTEDDLKIYVLGRIWKIS